MTSPDQNIEIARVWRYRTRDGKLLYRYTGSYASWSCREWIGNSSDFRLYLLARVSTKPVYAIVNCKNYVSPAEPIAVFDKFREAKLALRLMS